MKKCKVVYTVRESGEGKKFWCSIGRAFDNKDGSLNVVLDALPIDGKLHIREPREKDEDQSPDTAA